MLENSIQFSELSKLIEDLPNALDTHLVMMVLNSTGQNKELTG